MKIYKLKSFDRWAKSQRLSDQQIIFAVQEISRGLIDADMSNGLFKKRIARKGGGKRGGFRTLLAFQCDDRAIFLFGFAKNERENIEIEQLNKLRILSKNYLTLPETKIFELLKTRDLIEVKIA